MLFSRLKLLSGYLNKKFDNIHPNYNIKFFINILKIFGNWPPINGNKKRYIIWSIFVLTFSIGHLLLVQTAFALATGWMGWVKDTGKMASALSFLINNYVHLFKIQLVFRHQRRIQILLDYINARKFTCKNTDTLKQLQYRFSHSAFIHYANFQLTGLAACSGWILSSIFHSIKENNDRIFPFNAWYGYDARRSPIYEITLVFQSISLCICCIHNISMDGLIIGFMSVIGCEFEILKTRIKEIGNDVVTEFDDRDYQNMNKLKNEKNVEKKIYKELMLCVEHHSAIITYAKEFQKIFHSVIFIQFLDNCCVICMSAFALSQLKDYNLSTILGNLSYLSAIIYQLFMYCYFGTIVSIQVFNILARQNRIKILLEIMKSEKFSRYNNNYKNIINSYTLKGVFHHLAYQSFGTVAVLCWSFTPVPDLIAGNDRRLPMEGWYPYNVTISPAFQITYVHQTLAVIIACFQNVAMDTLATGLITVACCQIEILKSNLRIIGRDISKSLISVENDFKHCVDHHNAIIDFVKEIETIFSTTIIVQFIVNCIIICFTAFNIIQMKEFLTYSEIIGMIMYMCCMTYQIFIYCWHGNEIILQSESVVFAAYAGNWWRCGERYKRGLRLLMARAKVPITLKAGNLLTLSLQTFVSILRASYSLFTVLQSSTDK